MNYGLDLEKERQDISLEDWVHLGSTVSQKCIALIPKNDRKKYLPKGEIQRGLEDFQDCATRAPINKLEAKFTYLYKEDIIDSKRRKFLEDNGYVENNRVVFSDRYIAIKSGTTRTGNSLIAPLKAIHEYGLIPKKVLPASKSYDWVAYHDASLITREMNELGLKFLSLFTINYERVLSKDFSSVIDEDMLDVAGYAWPSPDKKTGIYPKDTRTPNHAFLYFESPQYQIFDNYLDNGESSDFIKNLASDYFLMDYGYRVFISLNDSKKGEAKTIISAVIGLLKQCIALLSNLNVEPMPQPTELTPKPVITPDTIPTQSKREKLYLEAYECLGKVMGLDLTVPEELNCANALSHVLIKAGVEGLPPKGIAGTATLYAWLLRSKDFIKVATPEPGDVVCYPTGYGNGSIPNGHVFIKGKYQMMSNNSDTRRVWDNHWSSLEKADAFYTGKGGFPRHSFRWIG